MMYTSKENKILWLYIDHMFVVNIFSLKCNSAEICKLSMHKAGKLM